MTPLGSGWRGWEVQITHVNRIGGQQRGHSFGGQKWQVKGGGRARGRGELGERARVRQQGSAARVRQAGRNGQRKGVERRLWPTPVKCVTRSFNKRCIVYLSLSLCLSLSLSLSLSFFSLTLSLSLSFSLSLSLSLSRLSSSQFLSICRTSAQLLS